MNNNPWTLQQTIWTVIIVVCLGYAAVSGDRCNSNEWGCDSHLHRK